jgi:hypothetical protein
VCRGQTISDVVVLAQPPLGRALLGRFKWAQRRITALHATTREPLIRRFLLLVPGDPCDELRRSESERILRAQPYLVDARVLAYDDGAGGVRLEVETRDEFSAIVGLAAFSGGGAPPVSAVRVGEANFLGRGVYTMGQWRDGGVGYRDAFIARAVHYQLFGRPYQGAILGERRTVGGQWGVDLSHPFYTDLQRIAWRAAVGSSQDVLELVRPGAPENALRYDRGYANVGGLVRAGTPGRLSLFGGSVSFERAGTSDLVQVLGPDGAEPDSGPPLGFRPASRYPGQRVARANALWGVRAGELPARDRLRVAHRRAGRAARASRQLDARAQRRAARHARRRLLRVGQPVRRRRRRPLVPGQRGARRGPHDNGTDRWRGLVVGGRSAWYLVPGERWRFVTSAQFSGVWRPRVPIQIQLGTRDGGVRGYDGAVEAGNARVVLRAESRYVLGALGNVGDLGVAAFADAGKLWAGEAPYGVNSPVRASIGLGALGAFPRGVAQAVARGRGAAARPRGGSAQVPALAREPRPHALLLARAARRRARRERGVAGQRVQLAVRRSSAGGRRRAPAAARRRRVTPSRCASGA